MSLPPYCFVEFAVDNTARYASLSAVFAALKHDKDIGSFRDDADWLEFFDDEALSRFWWPTREERVEWEIRWQAAPLDERLLLEPPSWGFGSLFEAFANCELELISCHMIDTERARLEYNPLAYPYGGTGCIRMLIVAFGFRIISEDDGTGVWSY